MPEMTEREFHVVQHAHDLHADETARFTKAAHYADDDVERDEMLAIAAEHERAADLLRPLLRRRTS